MRPPLMAPASLDHPIINANVYRALRGALEDRGCTAFVDGAQIVTDEISAIPDVVVTCSPVDRTTPGIAEPSFIVAACHRAAQPTTRA